MTRDTEGELPVVRTGVDGRTHQILCRIQTRVVGGEQVEEMASRLNRQPKGQRVVRSPRFPRSDNSLIAGDGRIVLEPEPIFVVEVILIVIPQR